MDFLNFLGHSVKHTGKATFWAFKNPYLVLGIILLLIFFWMHSKGKWKRKYKKLEKELQFTPQELKKKLIQAYTINDPDKKTRIYDLLEKHHNNLPELKQALETVEAANKLAELTQSESN